jgi:hypothetical protein
MAVPFPSARLPALGNGHFRQRPASDQKPPRPGRNGGEDHFGLRHGGQRCTLRLYPALRQPAVPGGHARAGVRSVTGSSRTRARQHNWGIGGECQHPGGRWGRLLHRRWSASGGGGPGRWFEDDSANPVRTGVVSPKNVRALGPTPFAENFHPSFRSAPPIPAAGSGHDDSFWKVQDSAHLCPAAWDSRPTPIHSPGASDH